MKFTELNLNEELVNALDYMGFETATPIQEQAIPLILDNKDVLACAQTGTGKTAAFVLPILNKLVGKQDTNIDTLIIVPTRELAVQIEQQIQGLSYFISVGSKAIYGGGDGADWSEQKEALSKGTDIIVATPGKLLSHLKMGHVNFKHVKHLVLDEADRMLDMGFIDDLKSIISYLPKKHQTLMFSATMAKSLMGLATRILLDHTEIRLGIAKPAEGVDHKIYLVHDNQKLDILKHIFADRTDYDSIIIFTSSKSKVSEIVKSLNKNGFKAKGISSNLEQDKREEVLRGFRSKRIRILVATDVMSRGIDIKEINMVINYDVPHDAADYVHRVGRTARANTKGEAFTLVNEKDMFRVRNIEKLIESSIPKLALPEGMEPGPVWKDAPARSKNKKFSGKKKFYKKPGKKGGGKPKAESPKKEG
ncbi:DEAD/DEAH box helicase [Lishizhenia sp.]|uniref:DEAD/DEAH box helicase n=1 Tax=Lishizhenia sp. TaxID=2497594 RepID=UPI00299D73A9|nr:DEAD/DEAH box helicase [Lishizhenia sp.]MDX1444542.1 DEAD/DEAH box helicase [Lishizhenia sp.]